MLDKKFHYKRIIEGIIKLPVFTCFCFFIFRWTVDRMPTSLFGYVFLYPLDGETLWRDWWNINQPFHIQLVTYLFNMFTFNFGHSFSEGFSPVIESIAVKAPYTIVLIGFSFAFALFFQLLTQIGTDLHKLLRRQSSPSTLHETFSDFSLLSYMAQIIIILILLIFSNSVLLIICKMPISLVFEFAIWSNFPLASSLISSILFLSIALFVGLLLLVRRIRFELHNSIFSIREQNNEDDVIFREYAITHSIPCLGAMTSIFVGFLLGSTIIIECFFRLPGLGRFLFESVIMENYSVLNALFFLIGASIIIVQLNSEVLYGVMVPRISCWMRTCSL